LKPFNVDPEGWESVDISRATPPDGALAFDVEGAKWIFTREGLDHLRSSATLRYTQHGLDLLRAEGYES
jgi:hypothetical protein